MSKKPLPSQKLPQGMSPEQAQILQKASPVVNSQVNPPVGGDFSKVEVPERRAILLRASPHARQPSTLWTKDRKLMKKFFVRRYLEYVDQLECEFADRASRVLGDIDRELDLAGKNDIYFNLRCEESSIFFHVTRREVSTREGLMLIKIPKSFYEVQRRAQLRYRVAESDRLKLQSEVLALWMEDINLLDVSSGGIGALIQFHSTESAAQFQLQPDERIHFHLDLGVFSFVANGEVRYIRREVDRETNQQTARIGIRFVGLPQNTVEAIQLFVMERSYVRLKEMFKE